MKTNTFQSLSIDVLEKSLRRYYKNNELQVIDFDMNPIEVRTKDGKNKEFYSLTVNEKHQSINMILKTFPNPNGINSMSSDNCYREISFFGSDLYYCIDDLIKIPIVEVCNNIETNERWILMADVSEELKNFGPPTPPTADDLKLLLYKMGKLHSLTWERNNLSTEYPWLMDFEVWVKNGSCLLKSIMDNNIEAPFVVNYLKDKPALLTAFPKFLEWLPDSRREILKQFIYYPEKILNYINLCPKAICHNDLHFSNIGLSNSNVLLIDWEFIGVAPTAWDIFSLYGGIPNPALSQDEAFEVYFSSVEENGITVDREAWIKVYRNLELIEILTYALRDLVPHAFSENSKLPEEHKDIVKGELNSLIDKIETFSLTH